MVSDMGLPFGPVGRTPIARVRPATMPSFGGDLGGDLDADGHPVGDDVKYSRALARLLHKGLQHVGRSVALDGEPDGDLLVPVADVRVQAEDAAQVDVTDHCGR